MIRSETPNRRNVDPPPGLPRWFDAGAAAVALLLLAPLLALLALLVAVTSPGPVLFRHHRIGRGGEPFRLLKLRTMRHGGPGGPGFTASDDPRITPLGRWLRRTKLDELPTLWNVLRGELALVGPRPEVPEYVDLDNEGWQAVLSVRPGLTDPLTLALRDEERLLARVEGSRERFYRERLLPFKLRGYGEYLRRRSWRSDLAVLGRTLFAVVRPSSVPPPEL